MSETTAAFEPKFHSLLSTITSQIEPGTRDLAQIRLLQIFDVGNYHDSIWDLMRTNYFPEAMPTINSNPNTDHSQIARNMHYRFIDPLILEHPIASGLRFAHPENSPLEVHIDPTEDRARSLREFRDNAETLLTLVDNQDGILTGISIALGENPTMPPLFSVLSGLDLVHATLPNAEINMSRNRQRAEVFARRITSLNTKTFSYSTATTKVVWNQDLSEYDLYAGKLRLGPAYSRIVRELARGIMFNPESDWVRNLLVVGVLPPMGVAVYTSPKVA